MLRHHYQQLVVLSFFLEQKEQFFCEASKPSKQAFN